MHNNIKYTLKFKMPIIIHNTFFYVYFMRNHNSSWNSFGNKSFLEVFY